MKVSIAYRQVNPQYNHDHAKQHNGGKESEGNRKYNWEEQVKINGNVKAVNILENDDFTWVLKQDGGRAATFKLQNMQVIQCFMDSGDILQYAVSTSLIDTDTKTHKAQKSVGNRTIYFFNLNQVTDYLKTEDGILIATADVPEELMARG